VVLEAMDRYPGKTVILMDIDCQVHGDIRPVMGGGTIPWQSADLVLRGGKVVTAASPSASFAGAFSASGACIDATQAADIRTIGRTDEMR
jgi:hypothetical protein